MIDKAVLIATQKRKAILPLHISIASTFDRRQPVFKFHSSTFGIRMLIVTVNVSSLCWAAAETNTQIKFSLRSLLEKRVLINDKKDNGKKT